jgi:hypothetical protein
MLSTSNYTALLPVADLQRLCQALAVLDAINSQDEEYRYYSYSPEWGENEAVFEMSDGEGDQMLALFRPEGCVLNGYLDGYDQPDKAQVTRGLPAAFQEFIFGEPVNSIGTTFCLWHPAEPGQGWQTGAVEDEDGSEELLFILDSNPATYAEWATEYYTEETDKKPVKAMVLALVDELESWPQLEADLQAIGYPYDFS